MKILRRYALSLFALVFLGFTAGVGAQGFPNKAIRLVVADAPGGAPDQLARLLAQRLSEQLGQQVIVDNRAGAGGVLGVRALATTGADRNPALPDLPTIGSTIPGYEIAQTWGIVAPTGTPPEVLKRLSDEIVKAMSVPDVKERVLKTGAVPVGDRPAEFEAFMANERQRLGDVIARSKIVLTE